MVAGVCFEYCLATGREDRLFGTVLPHFQRAGQVGKEGGREGGEDAGRANLNWVLRPPSLYPALPPALLDTHQVHCFWEVLEPYLLTDRLVFLPPHALTALLEHFVDRGEGEKAERCLVHVTDFQNVDCVPVLNILR
jgi:hypothetical protein